MLRSFSFVSFAGGNESGLKKFLLKYPSLFTVNGNMVSLFDGSKALASGESSSGADSAGSGGGGVAAGASASRSVSAAYAWITVIGKLRTESDFLKPSVIFLCFMP